GARHPQPVLCVRARHRHRPGRRRPGRPFRPPAARALYTLSRHDALPILPLPAAPRQGIRDRFRRRYRLRQLRGHPGHRRRRRPLLLRLRGHRHLPSGGQCPDHRGARARGHHMGTAPGRGPTRPGGEGRRGPSPCLPHRQGGTLMKGAHIAVVADDLTGAGDTAVQFVRAGWNTELQLTATDTTAQVVSVTTDSRALPADQARHITEEVVRDLRSSGVGLLYKKVDSTLRGPIRAEIDGALAQWGPDAVAVVCPAFPANGRTVRNGVLLVEGTEVHRTAVGQDPVTPVTESRVAELLGAKYARLTGTDARRDAELLRTAGPVAAVAALGPDAVPVGSAGLAAQLAHAWAPQQPHGPSLVVVTSLHSSTREQVACLSAEPGTRVERPGTADLADEAAWQAWSRTVLERFDPHAPRLALVAPEDRDRALSPADVSRRLGGLAARIAEEHTLSGLVVTGGDGARALTTQLQARAIALTGEVAPGIPIGTVSGGPRHGLAIVTKAGGFGSPTALLDAADAVRHTKGHNV